MGQFIKNNDSTEVEHETIHNLMEAACAIRHDLDSISSDIGISRSQIGVLYVLKEAYPEGCSRGEISDGLVETCPDVTRLIDRLEEEGLVDRYRSEQDARVSIAKITDKGIAVFDEAREAYLNYLERVGQVFSREECKTMSKFCQKLSEEMIRSKTVDKSS